MCFCDERSQYLRPLTGKYHEQIAECQRLLRTREFSRRSTGWST